MSSGACYRSFCKKIHSWSFFFPRLYFFLALSLWDFRNKHPSQNGLSLFWVSSSYFEIISSAILAFVARGEWQKNCSWQNFLEVGSPDNSTYCITTTTDPGLWPSCQSFKHTSRSQAPLESSVDRRSHSLVYRPVPKLNRLWTKSLVQFFQDKYHKKFRWKLNKTKPKYHSTLSHWCQTLDISKHRQTAHLFIHFLLSPPNLLTCCLDFLTPCNLLCSRRYIASQRSAPQCGQVE